MSHRFLRLDEVMSRVALRRSAIYRRVRAGTFPAPVHIGPNMNVWVEAEIDKWLEARIKESRAAGRRPRPERLTKHTEAA